jgi:hypothetical protein
MRFNFSAKNMLLGLASLLVITLLFFNIIPLAKFSFFLWIIVVIPLLLIFGLIKRRANSFLLGQEGENDIDKELSNLRSDYISILNGLDTDKGNIDKIVIGPTGVWTLEVKSHKGHITFDGQSLVRNNQPLEKNFLDQAYAEAMTLHELIKLKLNIDISIQPVVVFSSKYAKVRLGLNKYKGVYVIQKAWLNKLITETPVQNLTESIRIDIKNALIK